MGLGNKSVWRWAAGLSLTLLVWGQVGCFGRTTPFAKLVQAQSDLRLIHAEIERFTSQNHGSYPKRLGDVFPTKVFDREGMEGPLMTGYSGLGNLEETSTLIYFYYDSKKIHNSFPLLATYRTFKKDHKNFHLVLWTDGTQSLVLPNDFDSIVFGYHFRKNELEPTSQP